MNLNIVEMSVISLIFGLVIAIFILLAYLVKRTLMVPYLLEEALNTPMVATNIGKGIAKHLAQSAGGSNKQKMQSKAFMKKVIKQFVPEDKIAFLGEDLIDEVYGNPSLIPSLMKFVKSYQELGLIKAGSAVIEENPDILGSVGAFAKQAMNKLSGTQTQSEE